MHIYVLGNPLIKEDSLPIKLISQLESEFPKIKFIITDPNDSFPPKGEKNLIILDTVVGIKKVMLLNLDNFENNKQTPISPHDYDLLLHLLLIKKLKKINEVKIIGVPCKSSKKNIIPQVKNLINQLIKFNAT